MQPVLLGPSFGEGGGEALMRFLSPYPSELEVEHTSTSSAEVCYLDTNIKTGDINTPFLISIYNKRDDFTFRIVNFRHMDSNISAIPAYGVYISQLVRYCKIPKISPSMF